MNRNMILGAVGILALLGLAYFFFMGGTPSQWPEPLESLPATPIESTSSATDSASALGKIITLSEQNDSGESGSATLSEQDGKVMVTLRMVGVPASVAQPVHIHAGFCPDVGEVKYPLSSLVNGQSETTLNLTLDQLKTEEPLTINVHKSPMQSAVYVSCGNLEF